MSSTATDFSHDGMILFVGPVPAESNWWPYPQLFAVRGDGPPVVLSERLVGQRLVPVYDGSDGIPFEIRHIALINDGVRVEFRHSGDTIMHTLSWADIKRLLDEADKSARPVSHNLGDYRVLPLTERP